MTPEPIPEANRAGQSPTATVPLQWWSDGQESVSCWRLSLRERLSALLFGRVWLRCRTGQEHPTVALVARRRLLRRAGR